jgi:hypothetical protein
MSGAVKIDRRMYLTADGTRAVPAGDPEAATLLCAAGGELPHATAARYGLLKVEQAPEDEKNAGPEPEGASAVKRGRRPADKSRTPEGDK